jgi:hypothetical protein
MSNAIIYDGHDGYACPFCGGTSVDVDFDAQPDLACPCPCHLQDQQIAEGRRRDELRAQALGSYTPVEQVLDTAEEREAIWLMMAQLAEAVAQERRFVTCRCLVEHDEGCPVLLAQQILARLQETQP